MLIAEVDVATDVDTNADARAVAASLLPDAGPGFSVQDLLEFEPGRFMVSYLSLLDIDALDEQSASVALELLERQQAWLAELMVRVTARVAGPTPPPPNPDSTDTLERDPIDVGANLVAATLGMTSGGAQARVDTARAMTGEAPGVQVGDDSGPYGVLARAGRRRCGARGRP